MRFLSALAAILALVALPVQAQTRAVTCDELAWSTAALAANPDVGLLCRGVYVKGEHYYAKAVVRVLRAGGNRISFRPVRVDGSLGEPRSVTVPSDWRARIDGRAVPARDLQPGQELTVFIPQDRFAIALEDGDGLQKGDVLPLD